MPIDTAAIRALADAAPKRLYAQASDTRDAFYDAARIAVPALCDELDALREQLDAAQTALVDAETVKLERDALRAKIAKLRELAAEAEAAEERADDADARTGTDTSNYIYRRANGIADAYREVLAILDEVNNA